MILSNKASYLGPSFLNLVIRPFRRIKAERFLNQNKRSRTNKKLFVGPPMSGELGHESENPVEWLLNIPPGAV